MNSSTSKIIFIMGVSGSGKSTIGRALAEAMDVPFIDGDDHHPEANVKKMSLGQALDDSDRAAWLKTLNRIALQHRGEGAVIACSALKESYRQILTANLEEECQWVILKGTYELILERMKKRAGHFMPSALLQSQFDTLEIPEYGIHLDISKTLPSLITLLVKELNIQ
ncbi:MAG: gluconokinase [Bacteroidia bacterium]|nr:gluconokinase [Bacteroidia bacterium]